MPTVRYYDYGVLRMESDKRMLDAQRRSAQQMTPMRRVSHGWSEQTRPTEESLPIRPQDAHECEECDNAAICRQEREHIAERDRSDCAEIKTTGGAKALFNLSGEELLIAVLLLLAISEGSELPLILALLYLLM